jgi:ATP-dependent helicase Lhr and Lhr-like helicase
MQNRPLRAAAVAPLPCNRPCDGQQLVQAPDGTLLPGTTGERLLESRDIFAVFISSEEFKVIAERGRTIGQVPGTNPFVPGQFMVLAGRRWRIIEVDGQAREISVRPDRGGSPPRCDIGSTPPADGVVKEMRRVYTDLSIPAFLDGSPKQLLVEARTTFDRLELRDSSVARHDGQLLLFPWAGGRLRQALILALTRAELEPAPLGLAICVAAEREATLIRELERLAAEPPPDSLELAALVENKAGKKFDMFLGDDLLTMAWARDRLDVAGVPKLAASIFTSLRR